MAPRSRATQLLSRTLHLVATRFGSIIFAMARETYLRFVFVASLALFLPPRPLRAQLPPRLERCLPYPTLAQEIRTLNEPPAASVSESPNPQVAVVSVTFAPNTHLPESTRAEILKVIKSPQFHDDPEKSWLEQIRDVGVLGELQDSGYFLAKVNAAATLVDSHPRRNRYALRLEINEGQRYTLGDVRLANARDDRPLSFPVSELRDQLPMKRGDIFNASKVREGLRKLTALYNSRGYIDMTAEPETQNADRRDVIDLVVKIDEEKPYRIGKLEFLGLTEEAQLALRPELRPGDTFDPHLVDQLLAQNKSLLPADVSDQDVKIRRNVVSGLVDIRFDFESCPEVDLDPPR